MALRLFVGQVFTRIPSHLLQNNRTEITGIDSLNSAALRWLDTEANGTRNYDTKVIPRDLFQEEIPYLAKVAYRSG